MNLPLTDELRAEYQNLFDTCQIRQEAQAEVENLAAKIIHNRSRYEAVGTPLSIPWYFIGVIHNMESSQRFDRHLHNGDPLTARTVQVPAGRPVDGSPPFTWEASASDALKLEGLDKVTDWTWAALLYRIEKYNGFGYRTRHPEVLSPYLWSGSNHYTKGKFVADGKFDPDAPSKQCGAAVLLRNMVDHNVISPTGAAAPIT
jgi:lysozyme family protein